MRLDAVGWAAMGCDEEEDYKKGEREDVDVGVFLCLKWGQPAVGFIRGIGFSLLKEANVRRWIELFLYW